MATTLLPETVSFSTKGQVVIPLRLRREFEIVEGTRAQVEATPEGILIRPVTSKLLRNVRGSLKGTKAMETFLAERKKERNL